MGILGIPVTPWLPCGPKMAACAPSVRHPHMPSGLSELALLEGAQAPPYWPDDLAESAPRHQVVAYPGKIFIMNQEV